MRDVLVPLVTVLAMAGCDSLNKVKSENPVFPPAPPRLSLSNDGGGVRGLARNSEKDKPGTVSVASAEPEGMTTTGGIQQTKGTDAAGRSSARLESSEVVATVNGQPIFASEILDRYGAQLAQAREQAPPEEFRKLRAMLLQRDLPAHIERRILVQNLRSTLKPEQIKMLNEHLEKMFAEEMERLKKQVKVDNREDLENELAKQGTSLESLRTAFMNQRMAMEYLVAKSKYDKKIGRRELMDYYTAHQSEYAFPEKVKWQQIIVHFDAHGGKEKAYRDVLKKAIDELQAGADFGAVARKYSDGATKTDGGVWDWMQRGSLDDEAVEAALFEMPIDQISDVFVGKKSFQIVKVTARRDAGVKSFEELQDEIREKLELEARKAASQKLLAELKSNAIVDSPYLETAKK